MNTKPTTPARLPAIPARYRTIKRLNGRVFEPDLIVNLVVAPKPWGGPGAPMKWNGFFDDQLIVERSTDPEHEACRALVRLGISGNVLFVHPSGTPGLMMDVATGAKLSTVENDRGLRTVPYREFDRSQLAPRAKDDPPGTIPLADEDRAALDQEAIDNLSIAIDVLNGMSDEERAAFEEAL